ncbi:MAG: dTMP kinase [Rhodobacteraceae bacterium]|nr:dTMP kinase [Paracoccaceae bacterium]
MAQAGLFISLEGIDGAGKTTQARRLARALEDAGRDVLLTREPGGSPGAEDIRALVLQGNPDRWSPEVEILLFTAARRDHMDRVIGPALASGKIVICDRFVDSTQMYQGMSRGDLRQLVNDLHDLMIGREPDMTILITMDPCTGLTRAKRRNEPERRFEDFGLTLQQKIQAGYLELAQAEPARFRVIDGNRDIDAVAHDVLAVAQTALP